MRLNVVIKGDDVQDIAHALRFAAQNNPNLKRVKRWKYAMMANAIERRSL